MTSIILWFLTGAFSLVRKQLGYGAVNRHPSMVNAGDINRGKTEAAEIALRMYLEYEDIILSERSSVSYSTKPRRREALGSSSIPIRVEEFDGKNVDEFEEDIRDIFNNPYFQIQKNDGSTRHTMIKSVPYISTNDKMIFQKQSFAKRCIVYESNGSIPKSAMEHYSKVKGNINFSGWTEIGNMAVELVLNNSVNLKQPWDTFAIELMEIYIYIYIYICNQEESIRKFMHLFF